MSEKLTVRNRCKKAKETCIQQESAAATSCTRCRAKKLTCQVNGETRRKVKMEAEAGPTGLSGNRCEALLGEILAVLKKMEKSNQELHGAIQDVLDEIMDPKYCPGDVRVDEPYNVEEEDLARSERAVQLTRESDMAWTSQSMPVDLEATRFHLLFLQKSVEAQLCRKSRKIGCPKEAKYEAAMRAKRVAEHLDYQEMGTELDRRWAHLFRKQEVEKVAAEGEARVAKVAGPSTEPSKEESNDSEVLESPSLAHASTQ
jgi:hypothetical protein